MATTTLESLDALSRTRSLTPSEVRRLEWALSRRAEPKGQKPWLDGDVRRLHRYLLQGKKPAQICIIMGRTERAIWTKLWRLGWTVGSARKGQLCVPERPFG